VSRLACPIDVEIDGFLASHPMFDDFGGIPKMR
jgi:hypothetical protein